MKHAFSIFFFILVLSSTSLARPQCVDVYKVRQSSVERAIELVNSLQPVLQRLPLPIRSAFEKALNAKDLKILVVDRVEIQELGIPKDVLGFFLSRTDTKPEFLEWSTQIRAKYNMPLGGSKDLIVVVRNQGLYSKVRDQLTLIHEVAHAMYYKVILSKEYPLETLNAFLQPWNIRVEKNKTVDFVDELLAHYAEVMMIPQISAVRGVDILLMVASIRLADQHRAVEALPQKIERNYELVGEPTISLKEAPSWLQELMVQFHSQGAL
jgi:hypothetical protein